MQPFLGQISTFGFNFAPKNWAFCQGQLLPIQQNAALFSLLGTQYGGNGTTNFALPNLQGRVSIGLGTGYPTVGAVGGENVHTLINSEMPAHTHPFVATSNAPTTAAPSGQLLGGFAGSYTTPTQPTTTLLPSAVSMVGGNQPHENMQPFLSINFCIALAGVFPSRN